jgi:hypothetical protein
VALQPKLSLGQLAVKVPRSHWHTTPGKTPLDGWSVCRRDLYLTTHKLSQETNIHAAGGIRTHDPNKLYADYHTVIRSWVKVTRYIVCDVHSNAVHPVPVPEQELMSTHTHTHTHTHIYLYIYTLFMYADKFNFNKNLLKRNFVTTHNLNNLTILDRQLRLLAMKTLKIDVMKTCYVVLLPTSGFLNPRAACGPPNVFVWPPKNVLSFECKKFNSNK